MISNKKKSEKREDKIAGDIEGHRHVMSGATWSKKGDVSNDKILIEDKFTDDIKYSLTRKTILKNNKEAGIVDKIPVISLGFEKYKTDYAIIQLEYHKDYLACIDVSASIRGKKDSKSITLLYSRLNELFLNKKEPYLGLVVFDIKGKYYKYLVYDLNTFLD